MEPHRNDEREAETLAPLLGDRVITGPADSAEARLLVAHANMVRSTVTDLGPAGVHAAHSALIELTKAVARGRFDDVEPRLAPPLAQATKDLADRHLADPELSPTMLACELNVALAENGIRPGRKPAPGLTVVGLVARVGAVA
ncbi:hypothetical protein [Streptomyces yatensis]|uniref:Uncharacterized protein n=1 Tax=Streptomyces yatensis TaxID=155177 RepID=A0ABP4UY96_9ACTN|nr:hypothetical protein [Streptomyces yatensis]